MITVLFFADYRERLGCHRLELNDDEAPSTLSQLREQLYAKGERWRKVLSEERSLTAVNHILQNKDVRLSSGDEVAFFPPVTGG
ncbi:MoaD/ThiS family protein [Candidatus Sororendozoicomonas aggregata]|uniref:MoaD/ThiS family protein n=1 Tax=Candidatus Sororendozoicomonas aggregata TaxID=3073239 RepID=UPI002ED17476